MADKMQMTVTERTVLYTYHGCVTGKTWLGSTGKYQAKCLVAKSKSQLKKEIQAALKDGSLDSGFGFQELLATDGVITTITTLTIAGKQYTNEESEPYEVNMQTTMEV